MRTTFWSTWVVSCLVVVGCGGGPTVPDDTGGNGRLDGGRPDGAPPTLDGSVSPDAGPCHADAECDDHIDCTTDTCATGVCRHVLTPALCAAGESCNPMTGCVAGHACATDHDCVDTDACTTHERCDPAARVCLFDALDGDGDGDPPRVCGGSDCDDSNPMVSSTAMEICDGADDDCDTRIDEGASATCGAGASCTAGECTCGTGQSYCGGTCIDTASDPQHCGSCFGVCPTADHCAGSACRCAAGGLDCFGTCVDEQTDPNACGDCNTFCGLAETCVAGTCTCAAPSMTCGGTCIDTTSDENNCGGCGHACVSTSTSHQSCVGSTCTACGAVGGACCDGECFNGSLCFDGICQACGSAGDACCLSGATVSCNTGNTCNMTTYTCDPCGANGQACCGTTCGTGLTCTAGMCRGATCSSADGAVGAHCRTGTTCNAGAGACLPDDSGTSVDVAFGLEEGTLSDPAHPDYQGVRTTHVAAEDPPLHAWVGTTCGLQCDLDAASDACGTCATCSGVVSQIPLLAAFGGVRATITSPMYTNTGVCRIPCTFDPATRGATCPTHMTCDAFEEVCVEECTTSAECNMTYGATYAGELVSLVGTTGALTCNTTLGRCVATGAASAHVGDHCASSNDCLPGYGQCLNGGLCATVGCTTPGATCDGGRGVCLTSNENQNVCLRGCTMAAGCGAGNVCSSLGTTVGTFTGYCIGTCAADTDCIATETCDAGGRCVPRCSVPGGVGAAAGCAATDFCMIDHAGATYGFCIALDGFCGAADTASLPAASTECATGYVCDELLASGGGPAYAGRDVFGDGHCVRACMTNADCTTPMTTCVTSGPYAGLCRRQGCSASVACPTGQTCDVARAVCTETPVP
jgi:hypothetical protein